MANKQMGMWPSGYDWYITARSPYFLWVQGEVFYFLLLIFPFPFWETMRLFFAVFIIAALSRLAGYSIPQLARRLGRFWLGRERRVYSARSNYLRMRIGD
jgi:hypothetical protein